MVRIKKGDEVIVIAGRDKGKLGTVLRCAAAEKRLTLQDVIGQAPCCWLSARLDVGKAPRRLIASVAWRWVARDENNQQG